MSRVLWFKLEGNEDNLRSLFDNNAILVCSLIYIYAAYVRKETDGDLAADPLFIFYAIILRWNKIF